MITIINPSAGPAAATGKAAATSATGKAAATGTTGNGAADAKDAQSHTGFALLFAEQMATGVEPKGKTAAPVQTAADAKEKPAHDEDSDKTPALDPALAAALPALSAPNERAPAKDVAAEDAGGAKSAQRTDETAVAGVAGDKRSGPALPQAAEAAAKSTIEAQAAPGFVAERAAKEELLRPEPTAQAAPAAAGTGAATPGFELPRVTPAHQPEVPNVQVNEPFSSPRWGEAVASRVAVLVRERVSEANISINPPDLGPVRAQIRIEDGTATVTLSAAAPETRAALESALPDLRAQLSTDGIQLGDANVSSGPFARGDDSAGGNQARPASSDALAAGAATLVDPASVPSGRPAIERSLVDLYA